MLVNDLPRTSCHTLITLIDCTLEIKFEEKDLSIFQPVNQNLETGYRPLSPQNI